MFRRVNITGEWNGRFEYDDPAFASHAEAFVWQVTHERSGRVSGDCIDGTTGRHADLLGRIDGRRLEILKQYPIDPSSLLMIEPTGGHITVAEVMNSDEWRQSTAEFNEKLTEIGIPTIDLMVLKEEYADSASRIIYTGRVASRGRMEGRWTIPAFKIGLGYLDCQETRGTWWAERKEPPALPP